MLMKMTSDNIQFKPRDLLEVLIHTAATINHSDPWDFTYSAGSEWISLSPGDLVLLCEVKQDKELLCVHPVRGKMLISFVYNASVTKHLRVATSAGEE